MASGTRPLNHGRTRAPRSSTSAPDRSRQTSASADGTSPGTAHLRARPGRGRSSTVQRLLLVELALAAVLVGWVVGRVAMASGAVLAAVLVLVAFVSRRGRAVPDWLATAQGLRQRLRRAGALEIPPGTEPALVPALECEPALRTYSCGARDRRPVGVVGDGTFVTAVIQVEADATALRAERSRQPLPLGIVRDALEVDGIRLESAQIVLHTQPAPALHLPRQSVAVANYAPLQERTGTPAVRLTWVALKLDPELCPEAVAARGGGLVGAQKCVARAAHHLASRLTGAGFRATLLDEAELVTALATSMCANPLVTAEAGRTEQRQPRTLESARSWRCDNRRHTTYWIRRWPHLGDDQAPSLPQFVADVTSVPALATTFSLRLSHDGREVSLCGHLRVTGRSDDELVAARRALQDTARRSGAGLARLDREQLPGVLATLPLGGAR
ncbi:type VII secretion protein EccE [Streptomyces sp. NPDC005897]|uniref:type VII secretion protein EccE n=1 Tax=Streptomyces sp. NPDC005897 TaxID=3157081 RepID=UPI0033EE1B41